MKPEAPPSSKATSSTAVKSSNGTPADSTAQGRVSTEASRRQPSGDPGYSSFSRSMSSSFSALAASMIASSRRLPVSSSPGSW